MATKRFGQGEAITNARLKELADEDKCFWLVFESYDPSDYQYDGPACLSVIDEAEGSYYMNEAPNGVPVHQCSFSIGDWYFDEHPAEDLASDEWGEGQLAIYELLVIDE